MTKWKKQIDFELGADRKFTPSLEQKILQKEPNSKEKKFTYPLTFIGVCFIALILFFTWSENTPEEQLANSNSILLNSSQDGDRISSFYISYLRSEHDQFLARANTLAFGVKKYSSEDDIQVMMQMLEDARLANVNISGYDYFDAVLKFNSGKERKIKIINNDSSLGIIDLETKLYYEVDKDYVEVLEQFVKKEPYLLLLFIILYMISYLLICVNVREKAPSSINIMLRFVSLTTVILLVQQKNIILSIWLPVAVLIGFALHRLYKLQQDYDNEKLRKLTIYTILLIVMWGIVFVANLVGGVL